MPQTSTDDARRLAVLERLLEIPVADMHTAMTHAADQVAEALRADKVDAFVHDPTRDTLVAIGTSNQPLSALERKVGLDFLPIANGGRVVHVFQHGTFISGHLDRDPEELRGIREVLKIKSKLGVPLEVGGTRRGVLMIASLREDFFTPEDVRFAESIAKWVGSVAHRAELTETIAKNAAEQGRRAAAEELITVLAHDLRNHLSPITTRLTVLRRRAQRDRREPDVQELEAALASVGRLSDIIADILDIARIDQGVFSVSPESLDLVALVQNVAGRLSTAEHPIVVSAAEDVIAGGDPARLEQCLENLLANATQHSPKDAPVEVFIRREPHGANAHEFVVIDIVDQGPGVPPEIEPHIFERFVSSERSKGLGLGLYLAKRIASIHDGDLELESTPGKGAKFTLRLPISTP